MKRRLTNGNKKVKALLFSLPPIQSCMNHASCASTCYAVKAYKQYPSVKSLWDSNLEVARHNLWVLYDELRDQLLRTKQTIVRIHQSGDFISDAYIGMWVKLAEEFKHITFYGYTKVEKLLDISRLDALPNVNILRSMIDGNRNYGSMDYVSELSHKYNAEVCPATVGQEVKCGESCFKCMVPSTKVVFVQH